MPKTTKKIVLVVAAFIVVVFSVFLFNQTMQIVQSARTISAGFGNGAVGSHFHPPHPPDDAVCDLVPVAETDAAARNN